MGRPTRAKDHRREAGGSGHPLTSSYLLELLKNPRFRRETNTIIQAMATEAARFGEANVAEQPPEAFSKLAEPIVRPFIRKWGALPPATADLVDPDPRKNQGMAVLTGQWGVIPVFPWTTEREARAATSRARKTVGKQHQDAQNTRRAQLAGWLELNGIPRREIARAVWGRRQGLRRPTKQEAIRRLAAQEEEQLFQRYLERGHSYRKAERLVVRKARGSEAPASAAVRMAEVRYAAQREDLNKALASPKQADPTSYAVTMLLRAALILEDQQETQRWARALRDALIKVPST